jgi:hypothetical protein
MCLVYEYKCGGRSIDAIGCELIHIHAITLRKILHARVGGKLLMWVNRSEP